MADSVDNFSDLKELGIDINECNDSLSVSFTKAANRLQKILPNVDNQMLLTLYGYYKQGMEGSCNIPKPSWYDYKAKSKWESWNKLGDMSRKEAKQRYIDALKVVDPSFDSAPDDKPAEQWAKVSSMVDQDDATTALTIVDHIRDGRVNEIKKFVKLKSPNAVYDDLPLIHWAADSGNVVVLKELIELGANFDLLDSDGQTALHYSASCGHADCVKFLVQRGARKDIADSDGNIPSDVAADDNIKRLLK
ncbi:unnamed protein product [Psylliodes chrysocephalus]|uniref:Acyl-CoA-binding domain-containing protein 6 n=1 Tax=Psylliodes chrysocephalus TaxID=3402493 RepID=A0A9P0CAB6_9CUCU|nr:unnamed protein product [Psylliodes chrysocephala]